MICVKMDETENTVQNRQNIISKKKHVWYWRWNILIIPSNQMIGAKTSTVTTKELFSRHEIDRLITKTWFKLL